MLAGMPRLYSNGDGFSREREARTRKVSRAPASRSITISSTKGDEGEAAVRDISTHGCCVGTQADWLRLGVFISLRLEEEIAVMGIVRWVRDGSAGVEFLRPLQPRQGAWDAFAEDDV